MRSTLCMILAVAGAVHAQEVIDLHFYVRPPYMVSSGADQVTGLTAGPAKAAFEKAGVRFRWQQTPAKRQLMMVESGMGPHCGVGWYKTPEREMFGKFTAPLYRDKPTVALARADFQPTDRALAVLAADPAIRIVMKIGLTYGQDVAGIMARAKAQVQLVTTEQTSLARMVASDRADFMFSPQEEADLLVAAAQQSGASLKVLTFSDIRAGTTRHILCSKQVSDATIAKLNHALSTVAASAR